MALKRVGGAGCTTWAVRHEANEIESTYLGKLCRVGGGKRLSVCGGAIATCCL